MKPTSILKTTLQTAILAATAATGHAATTFNPAAEIDLANNQSCVWSYGHSTTLGSTLIAYNEYLNISGVDFSRTNIDSGVPAIGENTTGSTVNLSSAYFPVAEMVLHPGPTDYYSVLRFTAPIASTYSIIGYFYGVDVIGTTTDVHILENSNPVFNALVNGTGLGSAKFFGYSQSFNAGDTIDFVVGKGANSHLSDSTALNLTITSEATFVCPEPSSALFAGLGGLGFALRRRRTA